MPLWLACVILLLAVSGVVLARLYLGAHRNTRMLCITFCTILTLNAFLYLGLTLLLVNAVE